MNPNEQLPPITERQSAAFFAFKGLAICAIVGAHIVRPSNLGNLAENVYLWRCTIAQSALLFFFASGFFYKRTRGDSRSFWSKKFKTIVVPWLIAAAITFLYFTIKNRDFSSDIVERFFKWTIGVGTYFYFMTVLVCSFVYFKIVTGAPNLWMTFALTIASLISMRLGIVPAPNPAAFFLNPFNFFGFFALGILARRSQRLALLEKKRPILYAFGILLFIASGCARFYVNDFDDEAVRQCGFLSYFIAPAGVGLIITLCALSDLLRRSRLLRDIGKKSFVIYLYHMPIAGIVGRLLIRQNNALAIIAAPILVTFITYAALVLFEKVMKKIGRDSVLTYVGLR